MDIRQQLSLEQQFELRAFEAQVQELSKEEAQELLVKLRTAMLHQSQAFRELLKDAWGIGKDTGSVFSGLTED